MIRSNSTYGSEINSTVGTSKTWTRIYSSVLKLKDCICIIQHLCFKDICTSICIGNCYPVISCFQTFLTVESTGKVSQYSATCTINLMPYNTIWFTSTCYCNLNCTIRVSGLRNMDNLISTQVDNRKTGRTLYCVFSTN